MLEEKIMTSKPSQSDALCCAFFAGCDFFPYASRDVHLVDPLQEKLQSSDDDSSSGISDTDDDDNSFASSDQHINRHATPQKKQGHKFEVLEPNELVRPADLRHGHGLLTMSSASTRNSSDLELFAE